MYTHIRYSEIFYTKRILFGHSIFKGYNFKGYKGFTSTTIYFCMDQKVLYFMPNNLNAVATITVRVGEYSRGAFQGGS